MITTSDSFNQAFVSPVRAGAFEVGLIAQSNFNFPEGATPTVTAFSQKSPLFTPACAIDGETKEPCKYWILGRGCKIGNDPATGRTHGWCLFGSHSKHNLGWWSANKSDGSGNFSVPYPYLEISYSAAVDCNLIRVITSSVYPGIKEFVLKVQYEGSGSWTTIGTFSLTADETARTINLGEVRRLSKIRVEVTRTKAANDNAKLVEVEPVLEFSPQTTPATPYVVDYSLEKSSGESAPGKPAAPGVGANSLSVTFDRKVKNLAEISENQIITFRQGFGQDLISQGNFIIMEPPEDTLEGYRCQAYSSLQQAKFYSVPDLIFHNRKTSSILAYLLGALGIPAGKITFALASDPVWEWYILESGRLDGILGTAADHFGVAIYQQEDGSVVVRSSYGPSVFTFTDQIIKRVSIQPAATINVVVVHYSIVRPEPEDVIWSLDSDLSVPASSSATYVFPLSKSPATAIKSPRFTEDAGAATEHVTISSWRCNGFYCNLTLANSSASPQVVPKNGIEMLGQPLALSAERVYEARNDGSVRKLGRREFETSLFCASDAVAQEVANRILGYLNRASEVYRVELDRPMPHLQLRDAVTLQSDVFGVNKDVVITRISLSRGNTSFEAISREAVA